MLQILFWGLENFTSNLVRGTLPTLESSTEISSELVSEEIDLILGTPGNTACRNNIALVNLSTLTKSTCVCLPLPDLYLVAVVYLTIYTNLPIFSTCSIMLLWNP